MNLNRNSRYISFLQSHLTPQRLDHSLRVMRVMAELAPVYALDAEQAMTAGLLHDAAKDLPVDAQLALLARAGIPVVHPTERLPIYLHAPASACLIREELGITDSLLFDAIAAHSYSRDGPNFDSYLALCLRAADVLAPTHDWPGMKRLREVMFAGQLDEASLLQCGWLIEYLQELKVPTHPVLERKFNALSEKLGVTNSSFERW